MLNQVILIGRVSQSKKIKGVVNTFHLDIPRSKDSIEIDSPIIHIDPALAKSTTNFFKDGIMLAIKGRIETVIEGGYGTVTSIVAERITYLRKEDFKNGKVI